MEVLEPLFIIPGAQDDSLLPVDAGDAGPKLALSHLEVVPEHLLSIASWMASASLAMRKFVAQFRMLGGHVV